MYVQLLFGIYLPESERENHFVFRYTNILFTPLLDMHIRHTTLVELHWHGGSMSVLEGYKEIVVRKTYRYCTATLKTIICQLDKPLSECKIFLIYEKVSQFVFTR